MSTELIYGLDSGAQGRFCGNTATIESMFTDDPASLQRRATMHAALSDPARLRVTDALAAGMPRRRSLRPCSRCRRTCSPTICACSKRRGWSTRRRSEGDRRRTYLRLVPGALVLAGGPALPAASAAAVRVHRQLGPLASGDGTVAPGQQGPGRVGRHSSGCGDRPGRGRRRAAARPAAAPARPRHIGEVRLDGDLVAIRLRSRA